MATAADVEEFMSGPLVAWVYSCLDNQDRLPDYNDLVDGLLLYEVLLQIDPEPMHHGVVPSLGNSMIKVKNLDIIIKNIKTLYEEELGQIILVVPDCVKIGKEPESRTGLEHLQLLLLLLLGCAVQCPNKERFIEHIKEMDVEIQHSIVECIKQVTDCSKIVLTQEATDMSTSDILLDHIRRLVKERDEYLQRWSSTITQEKTEVTPSTEPQRRVSTQFSGSESYHLAVELADWKAKLRKQRQELEEKSEALAETKEELEYNKVMVEKLKQEVQKLMQEARAAKAYRDELDIIRERAERVDKLESEVQRYREKLSDIEFYKTRVEELRDDNRVLVETKEMLEEQLQRALNRGEHVLELEGEIMKHKQQINDLTLEQEANQEKIRELFDENAQLQVLTRTFLNESNTAQNTIDDDLDNIEGGGSGDNSLSEQLSSNLQARALKLELENRRLMSTIDNLKESSFHENSSKILELEKDKKKLSLKVDQLQESCQRLNQRNCELEQILKDSMTDNKKLLSTVDNLKEVSEKQQSEIQSEQIKIEDLEKNIESLTKEKIRFQCQIDSLQCKLDEQERATETANKQSENWKIEALKVPKLEAKSNEFVIKFDGLEKELQNTQRECSKLRKAVEEKDVSLDEFSAQVQNQEKDINRLQRELDEATSQISRLHDVERENQELAGKTTVDQETIITLKNDLVAQIVKFQQVKSSLEKLNLEIELLIDPETVLERIISSPEVLSAARERIEKDNKSEVLTLENSIISNDVTLQGICDCENLKRIADELRQELTNAQSTAEEMHSENAKLQVNISTCQSQITSLSNQHTALQLANSQLAAEKDEIMKERNLENEAHTQLVSDHIALQELHERLSEDYETVVKERDFLKVSLRDQRSEMRTLKEQCIKQEADNASINQEIEKLKLESRTLANLRAEHSSLKEDFRSLFTAHEKVKKEYCKLQEEYRSLRQENGKLKLQLTQIQGEIERKNDKISTLEVQLSKVNNQCDLLLQMNATLKEDRHPLMEQLSKLLNQYHELLTNSLEDKEQHHIEEKFLHEKLNNICRQKEKLEEKIMEYYSKMESCSTKKKSFGSALVQRFKKAGTDIMNKVPPRSRSSWHEEARRVELQDRTTFGSDSGEVGNDSDTSMDEIRSRKSQEHHNYDGLTQSTLSLGSAGTRRAVYYTSEDNNPRDVADTSFIKTNEETLPYGSTVDMDRTVGAMPIQDSRPLLVYNRINTTIQKPEVLHSPRVCPSPSQGSISVHSKMGSEEGRRRAENKADHKSVWFEYGCV